MLRLDNQTDLNEQFESSKSNLSIVLYYVSMFIRFIGDYDDFQYSKLFLMTSYLVLMSFYCFF